MRRSRTAIQVVSTVLFAASAAAQTAPAPAGGGGGAMAGSPYLGEILREDLYADVWERPGLSTRDRSLNTIAITQSLDAADEMRAHIKRGLDNGLTQAEIGELIAHEVVNTGFPNCL
jgi:4-carboxymuconolactone decarboxylase